MSTPQSHIDAMKALAIAIGETDFVRSCIVDDWGRDSNFQLAVTVNPEVFARSNKGALTNKIKGLFNRLLGGTGAHLRTVFSPEAQYRYCPFEEKRVRTGYNRQYWMVDVDFKQYMASINQFC